jgi:SagB-type dehydrogenase family enzyme
MAQHRFAATAIVAALAVFLCACGTEPAGGSQAPAPEEPLPSPLASGAISLEAALAGRRSVREFGSAPLTKAQIGQLLWAAQGITDPASGGRTAPSAGALYPLELYVATTDGFAHYLPARHALRRLSVNDPRARLAEAAGGQGAVASAPAVFVLAGVVERTRTKYGDRAERYVQLEAGHAAQGLLLEAVALGLGAVPVGAFDDGEVREILGLGAGETPLYLIPVGPPAP